MQRGFRESVCEIDTYTVAVSTFQNETEDIVIEFARHLRLLTVTSQVLALL